MQQMTQEKENTQGFYDKLDHTGYKFLFTMVVGATFALIANLSVSESFQNAVFKTDSYHVNALTQSQHNHYEHHLSDTELQELSATYSDLDAETVNKALSALQEIDISVSSGKLLSDIGS